MTRNTLEALEARPDVEQRAVEAGARARDEAARAVVIADPAMQRLLDGHLLTQKLYLDDYNLFALSEIACCPLDQFGVGARGIKYRDYEHFMEGRAA